MFFDTYLWHQHLWLHSILLFSQVITYYNVCFLVKYSEMGFVLVVLLCFDSCS
jgi:hypothetical protein